MSKVNLQAQFNATWHRQIVVSLAWSLAAVRAVGRLNRFVVPPHLGCVAHFAGLMPCIFLPTATVDLENPALEQGMATLRSLVTGTPGGE